MVTISLFILCYCMNMSVFQSLSAAVPWVCAHQLYYSFWILTSLAHLHSVWYRLDLYW